MRTHRKATPALLTLLALAAALLLAACGGNGTAGGTGDSGGSSSSSDDTAQAATTSNVSDAAPATGKKTIGVISLAANNGGSGRMIAAMKAKASSSGWKIQVIDAAGDAQKVSSGIRSLIAAKADGIVIDILDPSAVAPDIKAAKAAGIPVISVNSNDYDPDVTSQVVVNPFELGSLEATYIADQLGRKGTVAVLGFTGASNIRQRQIALVADLKSYPGIKIVETKDVDVANPVESARSTVQSWLTKYPKGKLNAIWGAWDEPATGAASAIDASNRDDILVTGADYSPQVKQLMQQGSALQADWFIDYATVGETALDTFANLFAKRDIPAHQYVAPQVVTKDSLPSGDFPAKSTVTGE